MTKRITIEGGVELRVLDPESGGQLRKIARKVLDSIRSEDVVDISPSLEKWLTRFAHKLGDSDQTSDTPLSEFEGINLDELDRKLVGIAGLWHIKEAYDVLMARREDAFKTQEEAFEWFIRLAEHQYGDLIHMR